MQHGHLSWVQDPNIKSVNRTVLSTHKFGVLKFILNTHHLGDNRLCLCLANSCELLQGHETALMAAHVAMSRGLQMN
jgi:hypothetical protein